MTEAGVLNWIAACCETDSPMLAAALRKNGFIFSLSDGTAAAGYIDGLLCVIDGWELEDLTPAILEALRVAAPSWAVILADRWSDRWEPRGDGHDARTPWVQRIRVRLGLAAPANPSISPPP